MTKFLQHPVRVMNSLGTARRGTALLDQTLPILIKDQLYLYQGQVEASHLLQKPEAASRTVTNLPRIDPIGPIPLNRER